MIYSDINKKLNYIFNKNNFSVSSIALISISLFYLAITFYSILVFNQFSIYEILSVSFMFFLLFIIFVAVFERNFLKEKIILNSYNIAASIFVLILLILFAVRALIFIDYYRTFPLLEVELGLGWHPDSAFHAAIIQSIINFGYPSLGQDGVPITFYHALSHYFDALIIYLTGIEVYDSYGLFYYFKVFLSLSTAIIFLNRIIKNNNPILFIVLLCLFIPMITGTWSIVGSHALWLTCILVIFSSQKVFSVLIKNKNSLKDFLFVFFLVLIISLGKVSVGFVYATFIGFILLLRRPRDYRVYLIGMGWILFFLFFQKLMAPSKSSIVFMQLSFDAIIEYLTSPSKLSYGMLYLIYGSLSGLFLMVLFRIKHNFIILIAAVLSLFVVFIVIHTNPNMVAADIFYFEFSLSFILIIFIDRKSVV